MDFSTIDLTALARLPAYTLPSTYQLQDGSGNGCFGDAPGYPTYFTRSVYTKHGNSPPRGRPQTVITYQGTDYVVDDGKVDYEHYKALLHRLWKPLPLDHPRTRLWIEGTYRHHQHCYAGFGDATVIFPVPDYKLRSYRDDPRWKDEYREAHRAEVDAFNAQAQAQAVAVATPENHNAVRIVRQFYPDYQPELLLIEEPPAASGDWWETEAQQPSEADCASTQRWGHKHPFNESWCQWCGRHYLD